MRKVGAARRAARYRATRRVAPTIGFARLECRDELPLAHHGRPAGRPYNRNHCLGDFLRDHQTSVPVFGRIILSGLPSTFPLGGGRCEKFGIHPLTLPAPRRDWVVMSLRRSGTIESHNLLKIIRLPSSLKSLAMTDQDCDTVSQGRG